MKMIILAAVSALSGMAAAAEAATPPAPPQPSSDSHPPCSGLASDHGCAPSDDPSVSNSVDPSIGQAAAGGAGGYDGGIAAHSEATGMGGPYEPLPIVDNKVRPAGNWPAATSGGYPACSGARSDDRCVQLYERKVRR